LTTSSSRVPDNSNDRNAQVTLPSGRARNMRGISNCSELDHTKAQGVRNRIGAADGFELIEK
jgi:hypothetical protein